MVGEENMSNFWKHLVIAIILSLLGSFLIACSIDRDETISNTSNNSQEEVDEKLEPDLTDTSLVNDENMQQIPIPRTDFVLTLPMGWKYELLEQTEPYGIQINGSPEKSEMLVSVVGQRLHENQDTRIIIENFLGNDSSYEVQKYEVDGISHLVAIDKNGSPLQFAFLETDTQFVIVAGTSPYRKTDRVFDFVLNSLEIIEERPREAIPAERYQLGDSSFSIRRLEEYKIEPFLENSFKVKYDWLGDLMAPQLDLMLFRFENSNMASKWLTSQERPDYSNIIQRLDTLNIEGFVEEPIEKVDYGPTKSAVMICGNEGLSVTLISAPNMPTENEDVFWTAIETIECDG